MSAVPAEAIKVDGTTAVNWLALTYVVASVVPFHRTLTPLRNPEPLNVKVKGGPPAVIELGETPVSTGAAG
jgi:hypothetical protein